MKIEFSEIELIALVRALTFVRFECKEYEAKYVAGSPHIAEVHKRVSEATSEYYKSKNIPFPDKWPNIEDIKGYLEVIKIRIKDTDGWNDLSSEQRAAFLRVLVYPYRASQDTFIDLIGYGDNVHSKK